MNWRSLFGLKKIAPSIPYQTSVVAPGYVITLETEYFWIKCIVVYTLQEYSTQLNYLAAKGQATFSDLSPSTPKIKQRRKKKEETKRVTM
jgi:hypothetical protein